MSTMRKVARTVNNIQHRSINCSSALKAVTGDLTKQTDAHPENQSGKVISRRNKRNNEGSFLINNSFSDLKLRKNNITVPRRFYSNDLNSKNGVNIRQRSTSTSPIEVAEHLTCPYVEDDFSTAKPYSEVPGPKPLPIVGNTWRLIPYIGQYQISDLGKVSQLLYDEYGKIVKMSGLIGRPDLLFVYDADEIEKVYRREGPTPFRPSMPCLVEYKSIVRKDFFGELAGVVGVHGEPWRQFRTRVQKPVLQIQTVRKYIEPIEQVTNDFIQKMVSMKDSNEEMPADFDNEIHKWSLECIGRVALDVRLGCLDPNLPADSEPQKIINAAQYALRNIATLELKAPFWRFIPTPLWSRYVNNMNFFIEICSKYIDMAMDKLKTKQMSSDYDLSLLERVLKNEQDPKIATIMALDLILVGIDTISMAVCSILYQLATRPEEQEKMYSELLRVLPDPNTQITSTHLDQLNYLKAFVKEVFRVYSTVIGNGRTLQEDMVICGYRIPKDTRLVFPTLVTGNMEDHVTDAETFKPERWMRGAEGTIHPYSSLPYGHGARMCMGRRFADLEIQVLLAKMHPDGRTIITGVVGCMKLPYAISPPHLIRSYKLEYHHKPLEYAVTFMYAPDGELKFKMVKR